MRAEFERWSGHEVGKRHRARAENEVSRRYRDWVELAGDMQGKGEMGRSRMAKVKIPVVPFLTSGRQCGPQAFSGLRTPDPQPANPTSALPPHAPTSAGWCAVYEAGGNIDDDGMLKSFK